MLFPIYCIAYEIHNDFRPTPYEDDEDYGGWPETQPEREVILYSKNVRKGPDALYELAVELSVEIGNYEAFTVSCLEPSDDEDSDQWSFEMEFYHPKALPVVVRVDVQERRRAEMVQQTLPAMIRCLRRRR